MEWTDEPGIGAHALLSDCAAALIDPHGTIAPLCVPDLDSPPLLWSLLAPDRGGSWDMHVEGAVPTRLAYTDDTLVAEALWQGFDRRLRPRDYWRFGPQVGAAPGRCVRPFPDMLRRPYAGPFHGPGPAP